MSTMKIWTAKYCLSKGIQEHDVDSCQTGNMIHVHGCYFLHGEGREWHRTREGAVAQAKEIQVKKLKSLTQQMKRISAIVFD